ncbi:hypothetical protein AVEN_95199-1 [Araneus ventricosus]|uniref:Uncharacterized protein n=1 Tax=Araneus ventricosus TaxID=182803 RepID=A0A4Y2J6S5_ARAVE|nr:hypothetical protein AVEN_95199-1 [Araneus ventricosus]
MSVSQSYIHPCFSWNQWEKKSRRVAQEHPNRFVERSVSVDCKNQARTRFWQHVPEGRRVEEEKKSSSSGGGAPQGAHTERKQNKICHLPNLAGFPRQASWTCRRLFWLAPCERAKISGLRSRGGPLP